MLNIQDNTSWFETAFDGTPTIGYPEGNKLLCELLANWSCLYLKPKESSHLQNICWKPKDKVVRIVASRNEK